MSFKRVTIYDIARTINMSQTTVYRALSGKGRINDHTRELILKKAEEMGYKANLVASSMARKVIKIGVVFDFYFSGFHDKIIEEMRKTFSELYDFKVEGVFAELDPVYDKKVQIKKLNSISKKVDAIIFAPYISDRDYVEFIDASASKGIPVITCINDIPHSKRAGTVTVNTRIVGEIGAQLLTILGGGKNNALFVSNKDILNQNELIHGFVGQLNSAGNTPIGIYETQNDERMGYYLTDKLINEQPDLSGIFVGISQSMGVCSRLIEKNLIGKVKLICVDIYSKMAEMLYNDVVQATIYQQTSEIGREAIMATYEYLTRGKTNMEISLLKPQILLKSNCKYYL